MQSSALRSAAPRYAVTTAIATQTGSETIQRDHAEGGFMLSMNENPHLRSEMWATGQRQVCVVYFSLWSGQSLCRWRSSSHLL
jgi:hypothetical protein